MTSSLGLSLDHLVVTTRFDLAQARDLFERLGFTLTPMGRHPMGSENHLLLFDGSYLELIGVPRDSEIQRKEVLDAPKGIDGLVYKTQDADALHAALTALGLPLQPLHAFGRMVERHGISQEARFRTVRAVPGTFEAGRVYYCQHLTPELIWLPEYQAHRNGAFAQTGLTWVTDDPAGEAGRLAPWAGVPPEAVGDGHVRLVTGDFSVDMVSPAIYQALYGALACESLGRRSFLGAIHLATRELAAVQGLLEGQGDGAFRFARCDAGDAVQVVAFNALLVFHPAGHA